MKDLIKIEKLAKDLLLSIKTIEKWFNIRFLEKVDYMGIDCAFCKEYSFCEGCPVGKNCSNTPYNDWLNHHSNHLDFLRLKVICPRCEEIAQEELMFLIGIAHGLADELEKELKKAA